MELSEKDLIYRAASEYLRAREPEELEEFEVVFDATFSMLNRQLERDSAPVQEAHGRLRFDSPFVDVTAIASVTWIVTQLVRAIARSPFDEDIPDLLDRFEKQLVEHIKQRQRVEGLVEALGRRVDDLARLRRDSSESLVREPGPSATPVDLQLRVKTRPVPGGLVLDYELSSPSGHLDFQAIEAESARLYEDDLKKEHVRIFSRLERLLRKVGEDGELLLGEEIQEELQSLGQDLYLRLFPDALKDFYRQYRSRIRSVMILTDEPWIPWEIVYPDEFDDDDFLCMLFPMTRWFAGPTSPAAAIRVERLLCVEAAEVDDYPTLPAARAERDRLAAWVEQIQGLEGDFLDSATYSGLIDRLEKGGFDLIHFAGHADYDVGEADRSKLVLTDRPFRTSKLTGQILRRIQEDRPLVVLDACRVAREGLALTGVGGWPDRWVRLGHCGALLCPQLAVRDRSAGSFSETLYRCLRGGATLGKAVLDARRRLRGDDSADPTYLAYSLYGHPNGVVSWGAEAIVSKSRQRVVQPRRDPTKVTLNNEAKALESLRNRIETYARRNRRALEPLILPRISRRDARDRYLPVIRESVEKDRHRVISILGAAGHGKSTVLGELYDLLGEQDLGAWIAIVDCGSVNLHEDADVGVTFGQAALGESVSLVETAGRLNATGASGILLIDTLDLLLVSETIPSIQRVLLELSQQRVTCIISCRDYDYQVHLEPANRRLPHIHKRIDRYTLPPFNSQESAAAARAFVRRDAKMPDSEAKRQFVDRLLTLSADNLRLQSITSSPLLLAMLCDLFGKEGHVPQNLTVSTLYDRYWDDKIASSRAHGPRSAIALTKPSICLTIAGTLFDRSRQRISESCLESDLELVATDEMARARDELLSEGVLASLSGGRLRFFHQTFLEYLMARWLLKPRGSSARDRLLAAIGNAAGSLASVHWLPVLRQMLTLTGADQFEEIVDRLPTDDFGVFRTIVLATVTRNDGESLAELLSLSRECGVEHQKILCLALDDVSSSLEEVVRRIIISLLADGEQDVAILAAQTAGSLLARGVFQSEVLTDLFAALDARPRPLGVAGEITGQLVRACSPALEAQMMPSAMRELARRFSSVGLRTQASILGLARGASTDAIADLLEEPLPSKSRVRNQAARLLEAKLQELIGISPDCRWRSPSEFLHADLAEGWSQAQIIAVGSFVSQQPEWLRLLFEELVDDLRAGTGNRVSRSLGALRVAVPQGAAETLLSLLLAVDTSQFPERRLEAIHKLAADLAYNLEDSGRTAIAEWYGRLKTDGTLSGFALVADVSESSWNVFTERLRTVAARGEFHLLRRIAHATPPAVRGRLLSELAPFLSRGNVEAERVLVVLYSSVAASSRASMLEVLSLACGRSHRVATAAASALRELAADEQAPLLATDLMPLIESPFVGVVDQSLLALTALQVHRDAVEEPILRRVCRWAVDVASSNSVRVVCDLIYHWVRKHDMAPPEVASLLADAPDRLSATQSLEAGAAFGLIRAFKVMAQLERPELSADLERGIVSVLSGINFNRISNGTSETIDVLSALARMDAGHLPRLVEGQLALPEKNFRSIVGAIRRVEGRDSVLLTRIAEQDNAPPGVKRQILDIHGV